MNAKIWAILQMVYIRCYCETGLNGGGYTFIPPNVVPKLLSEDITYLLMVRKKLMML